LKKSPDRRSRNRQSKQAFRSIRSARKAHLYRGGRISRQARVKYNLVGHVSYPRPPTSGKNRRKELEKYWFDREVPKRFIPVPEHFCLKTNPKESLTFLGAFSRLLLEEKCRNIHVSHKNTKTLGLEASYLFDIEIKKAEKFQKSLGRKFNLSGEISDEKSVNNALLAFGLLRSINVSTQGLRADRFDADYADKYLVLFKFGSKKNPSANGSASQGLTEYFDRCLKLNGRQLTATGRSNFVDAISEIVDNAEEHSKSDVPWLVLGRYEKETQNCSFTIVSVGQTIFESLSAPESTAKDVLEKIQDIVNSHRPNWEKIKALGGICDQTEENIWNVMAIQQGISSKKTETGDDIVRGEGLMEFMENINLISDDAAPRKIAIISGGSCIHHDFSYPIRQVPVRNSTKVAKQLTFNDSNLRNPPNSRYVFALETTFQGVIISGSFKVKGLFTTKILRGRVGH
jgi:hypothetical protein